MPSYPAKPYVVPHDDWFNNNSNNFEKKSNAKGIKSISAIHEFFYRQSNVNIGGSDNLIQTNIEKQSSENIIISSFQNSDESVLSRSEEKYRYSEIPIEFKSIKKRSFHRPKKSYKTLSKKNLFNVRAYLFDLKSLLSKIISKKQSTIINNKS